MLSAVAFLGLECLEMRQEMAQGVIDSPHLMPCLMSPCSPNMRIKMFDTRATYERHQKSVMVFSAREHTSLVASEFALGSENKSDRVVEILGTNALSGWRMPLLNISAQMS